MEDTELEDEEDERWNIADNAAQGESGDFSDQDSDSEYEDQFEDSMWADLEEMSFKKWSNAKWELVINCRSYLIPDLRADFKSKTQATSSGGKLDNTAPGLVDKYQLLLERIIKIMEKWPRVVKEYRVFETLAQLVAHAFMYLKLPKLPKKDISRLLLKALRVYEKVSKTRELIFLAKDSRATKVASNSLPRPLLEGRGPAILHTTEIILGVSAVGDTHLSELVRGVLTKKKMGNLGLEHSQVCFEADAAEVQEEVEIALHELLERVECNVLGLPEPVPVEIEFLLHEMLGKVEVLALTEAMHGPYEVGDKLLYIPCDWFPPECEENGKSF